MIRRCLICESPAVLTQEAAMGVALLIGLAGGALHGAHSSDEGGHQRRGYNSLLSGLAALTQAYPPALQAAKDVAKFHFAGFDCICLQCGALFNES